MKSHDYMTQVYRPCGVVCRRLAAVLEIWALDQGAPGPALAIRPKTYQSAMGKLRRYSKSKSLEDVLQLEDLAGARVVGSHLDQCESYVSSILESCEDAGYRLIEDRSYSDVATREGYRGRHLYFEYPEAASETGWPHATAPRIEVQVQSRLENVWAEHSHQMMYKTEPPLDPKLQAKLTRCAMQVSEALYPADIKFGVMWKLLREGGR